MPSKWWVNKCSDVQFENPVEKKIAITSLVWCVEKLNVRWENKRVLAFLASRIFPPITFELCRPTDRRNRTRNTPEHFCFHSFIHYFLLALSKPRYLAHISLAIIHNESTGFQTSFEEGTLQGPLQEAPRQIDRICS